MSDIKLEDLLSIASGEVTVQDTYDVELNANEIDIKNFIYAHSIKSHDKPIPVKLIYDFYSQWSEHPVGIRPFSGLFVKFFERIIYNGMSCFKVTPSSFGLPEYYSVYRDPRFTKKDNKKSKYYGVYPIAGYYIARFKTEENLHYLGRFKYEKDAARAYDLMAYMHFGKDANLNFTEKVDEYEKEIKNKKENP